MTLRRQVRAVQTFLRQRAELLDFRNIPDPRDPRGCRWSKTALLSTALFALAVITRSLRGAERLSTELTATQRRLGIRRRVPDSTLGDFLSVLDPAPLRRHLHKQVLAEHRRKALEPSVLPLRAISIDGKTVATLDAELNQDCQKQKPRGRPAYWLYRVVRAALISSQAPLCIDQQALPAPAGHDPGPTPARCRLLTSAAAAFSAPVATTAHHLPSAWGGGNCITALARLLLTGGLTTSTRPASSCPPTFEHPCDRLR